MPDHIQLLCTWLQRLRPAIANHPGVAQANVTREIARLQGHPQEAAAVRQAWLTLLGQPLGAGYFAETGVRSARGFWLELVERINPQWIPPQPDPTNLSHALEQIVRPDDEWIDELPDESWHSLLKALGFDQIPDIEYSALQTNLHQACRMLSYRLAGAALDRELLAADPALEQYESPFLAQNALLIPLLDRQRMGGPTMTAEEIGDIDVLLEQCEMALGRVRRKANDQGISVRLTYLLARLAQLIGRLRELLDVTVAQDIMPASVRLIKKLIHAQQHQREVTAFIGDNVSLLARNITDHASRHGEHYIAEDRADWWRMARSAAGGGIVIACMAMLKIKMALLHLPPLTEGVLFGLNYGLGFVLIHLLGFTVATKQPAMTAAAIAATLEESRPKDLDRLLDLAQNVVRTQFIAVLGNVGLALPVAFGLAWSWPALFGTSIAPTEKLEHLLSEINLIASGSLFFAAVAGVGLFLSGLVSGYFDNQARYRQLAARMAHAPKLQWLGAERAQRLGCYLDEHYGAILGNLFFGMYLGLVSTFGHLTGLPIDIRHVAFSSANIGTAVAGLGWPAVQEALPWAVAGVVCIALVNLLVSFSLALYVAMKSRQMDGYKMINLAGLLAKRFIKNPLGFFTPPQKKSVE